MRARPETLAFWGAVSGASAVSAFLLLPHLGDRIMHRDEALALMVARRPTGELLETVQLVRGGAPAHFLLAHVVAGMGGGLSATRALSAIFLIVAVIGAALLGRALAGPIEGAVMAWGVAVAPVALYYGQFARMYALFLALSCLALWCLVRALDTWEGGWWTGTAVFLVLNVYSHPYGVVVGLVAAIGALVAILEQHDRAAWRAPLWTAAGVVAGCLPLLAGYLVLASRLDQVESATQTLEHPPLGDVMYQAFAHFVGVPRAAGNGPWIAAWLIGCATLGVIGLAVLARRDRPRLALLLAWLVLPVLTLAIVRVQGTDNHVRYVIYALPAVLFAIAHGAVELGRRFGGPAALIAGLALGIGLVAVDLDRGSALADYRYRDVRVPQQEFVRGDARYLRERFARGDLFFGYDEAFAYGVIAPGGNDALSSARGTARAEGPLIVRSLRRLHGPIDHGWYVALVRDPQRLPAFRAALGPDFEVRRFGRWVLVRTRDGDLSERQFAERGLLVFEAARRILRDPNADTTAQALRDALRSLRDQ